MDPQLQNRKYPPVIFFFEFLQGVDIPRVQHHRLFTDGIRSHPQGKPGVGIMEMVRGTDADIVNPVFFTSPPKHFDMPIKSFKLGKEPDIIEIAVKNPGGVMRVNCGNHVISRVFYSFEMTGGDIAGYACQSKVLTHAYSSKTFSHTVRPPKTHLKPN
jgi:hypothetical protein